MTTSETQTAIHRFREDPDSARVAPTATAVLANGHARISTGPFNFDTDLPSALGGTNQAPTPTGYLLGALAGCAVAFINDTLAPEFRVEIRGLEATAGCSADLAGLLGLPDHDPALAGLSLTVQVDSLSNPASLASMREAWIQRCPILLALVGPVPVELAFT